MTRVPFFSQLHRFTFRRPVDHQAIERWCLANIRGYWRITPSGFYHVLIQDDQDVMLFKLAWSNDYRAHRRPSDE